MRDDRINVARKYWNFKWPEELWTGIMFFQGLRITREQFEKESGDGK